MEAWKYPMILLFGIGISNVGAWIYFIALNLIVLDITQSALAISALYILSVCILLPSKTRYFDVPTNGMKVD